MKRLLNICPILLGTVICIHAEEITPQPEKPNILFISIDDLNDHLNYLGGYPGKVITPMIDHMDQNIGKLVSHLKANDPFDNTLILFLSDNGACQEGGKLGGKMPPLTGSSLVPTFNGKTLTRTVPMYFEHKNNAAITIGDMKLVGSNVSLPEGVQEQKWELYDLKKDRTELHDLAQSQPERVAIMSAAWSSWANSANVYPKPHSRRTKKKAKANIPKNPNSN